MRGMTKPKLAERRGCVAATRGFGAGPESSLDTLTLSGRAAQLGKVHPLTRESLIMTTDARRPFRLENNFYFLSFFFFLTSFGPPYPSQIGCGM